MGKVEVRDVSLFDTQLLFEPDPTKEWIACLDRSFDGFQLSCWVDVPQSAGRVISAAPRCGRIGVLSSRRRLCWTPSTTAGLPGFESGWMAKMLSFAHPLTACRGHRSPSFPVAWRRTSQSSRRGWIPLGRTRYLSMSTSFDWGCCKGCRIPVAKWSCRWSFAWEFGEKRNPFHSSAIPAVPSMSRIPPTWRELLHWTRQLELRSEPASKSSTCSFLPSGFWAGGLPPRHFLVKKCQTMLRGPKPEARKCATDGNMCSGGLLRVLWAQ